MYKIYTKGLLTIALITMYAGATQFFLLCHYVELHLHDIAVYHT